MKLGLICNMNIITDRTINTTCSTLDFKFSITILYILLILYAAWCLIFYAVIFAEIGFLVIFNRSS